jgi:hypothetical protein
LTTSASVVPVAVTYSPVATSRSAIRSTAGVGHRGARAQPLADALQRRHAVGRVAAVPVGVHGVLERPDDRHAAGGRRIERQQAVVLEQHRRLVRGAAGEGLVRRRVHRVGADRAVRPAIRVELAEAEAQRQHVPVGPLDVRQREVALGQGLRHGVDHRLRVVVVGGVAVEPGAEERCVGLRLRGVVVLRPREVAGREGVGDVEQRPVGE